MRRNRLGLDVLAHLALASKVQKPNVDLDAVKAEIEAATGQKIVRIWIDGAKLRWEWAKENPSA